MYSQIDNRLWGDEKFKALGAYPCTPPTLWMALLAPPRQLRCAIPGVLLATPVGFSEALGWSPPAVSRDHRDHVWDHLTAKMALDVAPEGPLMVLKRALRYHRVTNLQAVKAWAGAMSDLTECPLRTDLAKRIHDKLLNENGRSSFSVDGPGGCPGRLRRHADLGSAGRARVLARGGHLAARRAAGRNTARPDRHG